MLHRNQSGQTMVQPNRGDSNVTCIIIIRLQREKKSTYVQLHFARREDQSHYITYIEVTEHRFGVLFFASTKLIANAWPLSWPIRRMREL